MGRSDNQESKDIEIGKSTTAGANGAESENANVPQENVNSESISPGVITYTAPVNLGYDTRYKTRLTGKLKVAQIVRIFFKCL